LAQGKGIMSQKDWKLVQTKLPEQHKETLDKLAKSRYISVADYLREVIIDHIKAKTPENKSGAPQLAEVK
jgi:hypothetical protein